MSRGLLVGVGLLMTACGGSSGPVAADVPDVSPDVPDVSPDVPAPGTDVPEAAPDTGPELPPPPAVLPAGDYCEASVDVFCPYYIRCGRMAVDSLGACEATFLEVCNAIYEPIYAALADLGLLELSAAGLDACADHLADVPCEAQVFDLDGPCRTVWTGLAGPGEPCGPGIESFVCAPDATCVLDLSFCGACEAAQPTGGSCAGELRCHPWAHCPRVVTDVAAIGEPCASGLGGLRCAGGAGVCFPEPTGTSCKAFGGEGSPCSAAPCGPGLLCMTSPDPAAPVCDAPRAIGEPCTADVHCAAGLACFAESCAPGLGEGESCTGPSECGAGLTCDPADESCAPGAAAGETCYTPSHCAEGLGCAGLGVGLVCVPSGPDDGLDDPSLPGFLEPCDGACQTGLACQEGPVPGLCVQALCASMFPSEENP